MNARLPKGLFLLLAGSAAAYFRHYYPLLPNIMASHFDARGVPNGWSSKQAFFEIFAGMTLLAAVLVFRRSQDPYIYPEATDQSAEQGLLAEPGAIGCVDGFSERLVCVVWMRRVWGDPGGIRLRSPKQFACAEWAEPHAALVRACVAGSLRSYLDDPAFWAVWPSASQPFELEEGNRQPVGESPRRLGDDHPDFAAHAVSTLFAWYDDFD